MVNRQQQQQQQQEEEEEKNSSKQWIKTQLDEARKRGVPESGIDQLRLRFEDDERQDRIHELGVKAYETEQKKKRRVRKRI